MRRSIFVLASIGLGVCLILGCSDSPELSMQKAQIALSNGQADQALKFIEQVLKAKPGDFDALLLKARAQMMVFNHKGAKDTLDKLVEAYPDKNEVHEYRVQWTYREMERLLEQSTFATNEKLQKDFDGLQTTGLGEVDWLEAHGTAKAEAEFRRARYKMYSATRYQVFLERAQRSLTAASGLEGPREQPTSDEGKMLEKEVERAQLDAEQHLRTAIEADPSHFRACEMYTRLLVGRERWLDLWDVAQSLGRSKDIPSDLADTVVTAILSMPEPAQPIPDRIDLGRKILNAVDQEQRNSPRWLLASGRLHLAAQEWPEAQEKLEKALKNQPGDVDGQFLLAQVLYYQKKLTDARGILENVRKKANRSSRIETLYGKVLMNLGEMIQAKEALRRAIDLNPEDPMAREAFLALMAQEGHLEEAQTDVEEYIKKHPADARAIRFKMQFDQAMGKRDAVQQILNRVAGLSPLTDEHVAILVDGYFYLGKYDRAQDYAQMLVRRNPDDLGGHIRLAEAMLRQGRDEEVKKMLGELVGKFEDVSNVNYMLGRLYLAQQSYDRAVQYLQQVVDAKPTNIEARLLLAQAMAGLYLPDDAIEQIEVVLEQDPGNVAAHALAAGIYQVAGQTEKANQHLEMINESKISERTSPVLLAQLKLKKGDTEGALAVCNRAIAAGNPDTSLRRILAQIYLSNNNISEAESQLLAWVRTQPNNPQPYAVLSQFYLSQLSIDKGLTELAKLQSGNEALSRLAQATLLRAAKRPDEALRIIEPIYAPLINRRDALALPIADAMAQLHVLMGNRQSAYDVYEGLIKADFRKEEVALRRIELTASQDSPETTAQKLDELAAKLTADQPRIRFQVIRRYSRMRLYDRALSLLEKWISEKPNQATLLQWKGDLLQEMGKIDEAIAVFTQARDINRENVSLWLRLATAYWVKGDHPGAEAVLNEAAKLEAGARVAALTALGRMFVNLGLNRQAMATLDELQRLGHPRDPRLLYAMGVAYTDLKQSDSARDFLLQVPDYAPQYPAAQIRIARLDQTEGKVDQARDRLQRLVSDRRYAHLAVQELAQLRLKKLLTGSEQDMLDWVNKAMSLERLPKPQKFEWLRVRLALQANQRDWPGVLESLRRLDDLEPNVLAVTAAKIALLIRNQKEGEAVDLYRASAAVAASPIGPMFAAVLAQPPPPTALDSARTGGFPIFLEALIRGDLAAARSSADNLEPRKAIYKSDLQAMLQRPDVESQDMILNCAHLGVALVALDFFDLPQLAEELARTVIKRQPSLVAAHAILTEALSDQNKPLDDCLQGVKNAIPTSALALYLSARQNGATKNYTQAVSDLQQLIQREPNNDHVDYFLCQMYQSAGQFDQAIAQLRKIISNPNHRYRLLAANDLAYLLAEHQPDKLDEAYQLANQTYKAMPNMLALIDTIGWIEHLRGNDPAALSHLAVAIVGLKEIPDVHYHLGVVYNALGNKAWAAYHLREVVDRAGDRPEFAPAGQLLRKLTSSSRN